MKKINDGLTKSQRHKRKQNDNGLEKVTLYCPDYAKQGLIEIMTIICEFHKEKNEFHRELYPSMYRDFKNGKMGNKSLYDVKLASTKREK